MTRLRALALLAALIVWPEPASGQEAAVRCREADVLALPGIACAAAARAAAELEREAGT